MTYKIMTNESYNNTFNVYFNTYFSFFFFFSNEQISFLTSVLNIRKKKKDLINSPRFSNNVE